MRTRQAIHTLTGHLHCSLCRMPGFRTASDHRLHGCYRQALDLAAGKSITTHTHHKKSVRALAIHPTQYTFASGSAGGNNIKTWRCPEGTLVSNMAHDTIVNTLSANADVRAVLVVVMMEVSNSSTMLRVRRFQVAEYVPQPGSLDAEAGVFCSTFDQTGTRLITVGRTRRSNLQGSLSLMCFSLLSFLSFGMQYPRNTSLTLF